MDTEYIGCDKCPAEGLVVLEHIKQKTMLVFCGHHTDKFIIPLLKQGFTVSKDKRYA